ncbi:tetratricopeptide repeat protein [bacterium AH-315-L21]|nr:tetratricopeptide repeat protein [bacterium AH-315-L21]
MKINNNYRIILCLSIFCTSFVLLGSFATSLYTYATPQVELGQLKSQLANLAGAEKIDSLTSISNIYLDIAPKESIVYANKALTLSTSLQLTRGIIDSYNNLGMAHYFLLDYDRAIYYFEKAIGSNINEEYETKLGYSLNGLGLTYQAKGEIGKAMTYYKRAISFFIQSNYKEGIANSLNNIGTVYSHLLQFDTALEKYYEALLIHKNLKYQAGIGATYNNIAVVYEKLGNNKVSIDNYLKAITIFTETGNKERVAILFNNIGLVFVSQELYNEAIDFFHQSILLSTEIGNESEIATSYNNIGIVLNLASSYQDALANHLKALEIRENINDKHGIVNSLNNIGTVYFNIDKLDKALEFFNNALTSAGDITSNEGIKSALFNLSKVHYGLGNFKEAYSFKSLYSTLSNMIADEVYYKNIADMQEIYETEKKAQQILLLTKDNEVSLVLLNQQRIIILSLALIVLLVLILGIVISKEKKKSDNLLHNILPKKVARELKKKGRSKPESFNNVTVFFSDIVGFTNISSTLSPESLINELNDMFTAFDNIMAKYKCERIKTIGDAYLAVCGLPNSNEFHAENITNASIEIMNYMRNRNLTARTKWEIRVGIHSGEAVAGIVGTKKYIYDVFGDAINMSQRMESNSEPMRINLSEISYSILKDKHHFIKREPRHIKGKGLVNMYFLDC